MPDPATTFVAHEGRSCPMNLTTLLARHLPTTPGGDMGRCYICGTETPCGHRTLLRMEAEGELRREPGTRQFKRADLKAWRDRHRAGCRRIGARRNG